MTTCLDLPEVMSWNDVMAGSDVVKQENFNNLGKEDPLALHW